MSIFGKSATPPPPPSVSTLNPPPAPRPIDASLVNRGRGAPVAQQTQGFSSLVTTGASGLKRKARGSQQSLVGQA